ncbi:MAG: hypothetical protein LBD48_05640, partial [Treponema sp.]|nr:hypothetical protein [Treponema sp.]
MRMKNGWNGLALFFAATAVLTLTGCPQEPEAKPLSSNAALAAIALNGKPGQVPAAVSRAEFESPVFDVNTMAFTHLYADSGTALADAAVLATPAEAKASIQYSKDLITWNKTGKFAFVNEEFVYVSVRSADGNVRNYYKAQVHDSGNIAAIMDVKINGKIALAPPEPYPKSAASLEEAISSAAWNVDLVFGLDNANVTVEGTPASVHSVVQAGKVEAGSTTVQTWLDPVWVTTQWPQNALEADKKVWAASNFTFNNGDYAAFKCVSPDGLNTQYFAIKAVKIENVITAITIGGNPANMGTSAETVAGLTNPGTVMVGVSKASSAQINVTTVDPAITVKYAKVTGAGSPSFADTAVFAFANDDWAYVEATVGSAKLYFKIKVSVKNDNAALAADAVTVNTTPATIGLLTSGMWGLTGTPGTVYLTAGELAATITVNAANSPAGSQLEFGIGTPGPYGMTPPAVWNTTGNMGVIAEAEGKPIVIRVTAEDELTINYYCITLAEAGPPVLTSLSLGGSAYPPVPGTSVTDLGTPDATLAGLSAGSVTLDAATAAGTTPWGG